MSPRSRTSAGGTEILQVVGAPPRLAILGGGQLARMTALAAHSLGIEVGIVAEPGEDAPALEVASRRFEGKWSAPGLHRQLREFGGVVTLENEFVDPALLGLLADAGLEVHPGARAVGRIQDKWQQKQALEEAGLPVPRHAAVSSPEQVQEVARELGWPLILKARTMGYDGKGNARLDGPTDVRPAWEALARHSAGRGGSGALMVEEFVGFERELAIQVARGRDGAEAIYPLVETVQEDHICHHVTVPATVAPQVVATARELAVRAARALDYVGLLALELFLCPGGSLLINELAPRVHNSGHYTMEACECSQFENHVRAVVGWPLGDPRLRVPAACMVNLLGAPGHAGTPVGLERALAMPGVHLHLYGKRESRPGRKMGHITVLGGSPEDARERALVAAAGVQI